MKPYPTLGLLYLSAYLKARGYGVSVFDGPFIETKELLGGYVVVSAASLDEAGRLAVQYLDAVEADEVDLRELA